MSVVYLLISLSILMATCFLGAFLWAVRSGQYDDTSTPSMRVLMEDSDEKQARTKPGNISNNKQNKT
jgi:cbb3-type cytochrome oxidase maturation protein